MESYVQYYVIYCFNVFGLHETQEAERLREVEERKAELLERARRRAKTKVEAAIGA